MRSNLATTSSFQIEKKSGSRLPILKIKTDSVVLERPHLSFTARENMKAGENVQKIAVKCGVHTENDRFFPNFRVKKTVFILPYIPSFKALNVDTSLLSKTSCVKVKITTSEKQKSKFY